jgi:16S rRNA G966 N2-methylase RsmD
VLGDLLGDAAQVRQGDALQAIPALEQAGEVFDLVFADPPYEDVEAPRKVLEALGAAGSLLAPGVLVTIQHSRRVALPEKAGRLVRRSERLYGDTALSGYELGAE